MFKMSRVAIEMYLEHLFQSVYVSNCFQFRYCEMLEQLFLNNPFTV